MNYEIVTKPHIGNTYLSVLWQTDENENRIHIFTFHISECPIKSFTEVQKKVKDFQAINGKMG